jgi:hypothetical protein
MGFHPWVARTQDDFARMLRLRGIPGDHERASESEEAALAAYGELSMRRSAAVPARVRTPPQLQARLHYPVLVAVKGHPMARDRHERRSPITHADATGLSLSTAYRTL